MCSCGCHVIVPGLGRKETASVDETVLRDTMRDGAAGVRFFHRDGIVSGELSSTPTKIGDLDYSVLAI